MKRPIYLLFTLLLCGTMSCLAQTQEENKLKDEFYKQLNALNKEKKFQETLAKIRKEGDYLYMLQESPQYARNEQADTLPRFTYMNQNDIPLIMLGSWMKTVHCSAYRKYVNAYVTDVLSNLMKRQTGTTEVRP